MKLTEVIQVLLVPVLSALCIVMYNINDTMTEVRIELKEIGVKYDFMRDDVNILKGNQKPDNTVGR